MGNKKTSLMDNKLLETDRIVKINNFNLCVIQNINHNRRNIRCKSNKLSKYIEDNKLNPNINYEHMFQIQNVLNTFDDIELIKIVGYY